MGSDVERIRWFSGLSNIVVMIPFRRNIEEADRVVARIERELGRAHDEDPQTP